jgi:Taurine catabolism dioxygenase TauD, TfdA family
MAEENSIAIEVLPTRAALGADVRGIDLSRDFDAAVFRQIYKAWNDYLVLRFRDQWLDDAVLVTFSRRFGELDMAPTPAVGEPRISVTLPEVAAISNIVQDGKAVGSLGNSELVWHQDMSYNELPPRASLLYGIETPPAGGETFFYNLYDAYATLPDSRLVSRSCRANTTRHAIRPVSSARAFRSAIPMPSGQAPFTPWSSDTLKLVGPRSISVAAPMRGSSASGMKTVTHFSTNCGLMSSAARTCGRRSGGKVIWSSGTTAAPCIAATGSIHLFRV